MAVQRRLFRRSWQSSSKAGRSKKGYSPTHIRRPGSLIRCLVLSERKDFSKIGALSDAWLPGLRMWVGEYPFLLRPAFEELCQLRLNSRR